MISIRTLAYNKTKPKKKKHYCLLIDGRNFDFCFRIFVEAVSTSMMSPKNIVRCMHWSLSMQSHPQSYKPSVLNPTVEYFFIQIQ